MRKCRTDNKSGKTGVYWCNTKRLWIACIYIDMRKKILGQFNNKKDAIKARTDAEKVYIL